jgi:hypothetical protein
MYTRFEERYTQKVVVLNCNLSNSLKNLPTLFQKWFEYFHRNKS